ncbi:formate dehydrogenase accessory protein FdhE [Snodgrassella sp. CFCC 13594]|uniref:formate dehydrogenase accessory protein FdhE n=1 Tax=Snodgrassella sp. CFCC 13594 TaxID=1775559 RepID=UPI0008370FF4|nr:formate dehydrogenase accessory protein FdhE [Snodgrassella sp. CFCC 13594]
MAKIEQSPEAIQAKPFFHIPFWVKPDAQLFATRAARFRALAADDVSDWARYLLLLAKVCEAQQILLDRLPDWTLPEQQGNTLPLATAWLSLNATEIDALYASLHELLEHDLSPTAKLVWGEILAKTPAERQQLAWRVLQQPGTITDRDYAVWVHALMQVVWTRAARQLNEADVVESTDESYCPCCGADAVGSVVIGKGELEGVRYLQCSLCNSRWHVVRAKCTFCGNGKGMQLHSVEKAQGALSGAFGECCSSCHGYRKFYQFSKQQYADVVADDLATLALDMLLADEGYQRGGANPFLMSDAPQSH